MTRQEEKGDSERSDKSTALFYLLGREKKVSILRKRLNGFLGDSNNA